MPSVSIVINNHNYGRFLGEAIDSALAQTSPPTEVVVVDDGSTDDSRAVIARYGERIVPVLKENGGQASAFNAGFAASRGDIMCFLDADDLLLPDRVARIAEIFAAHPQALWCFHPLQPVDGDLKPLDWQMPTGTSGLWDYRAQMRNSGRLPYIPSATSGLAFRRELLETIFPLPEFEAHGDNLLKYLALAFGPGYVLYENLSLMRIHGNNRFTGYAGRARKIARRCIRTAYWLGRQWPELTPFTDRLLSQGINAYWRLGGIDPEDRQWLERYLTTISPWRRARIWLRSSHGLLLWRLKGNQALSPG